MKKILFSLVLLGMIVGMAAPLMVSAQAPDQCTIKRNPDSVLGSGVSCESEGNVQNYDDDAGNGVSGAMCCLFSTLLFVIDWMFMIIMVVVVLMILIGAFTLMTSGGSEEGISKGRNYIIFALIGVAVALLSRALPYLIKSIMGI